MKMRPIGMGIALRGRRWLGAVALLMAAGLTTQFALGRKKDKPAGATTMPMPMDDRKRTVHALNRLTFGPRPGDVERVAQMGVDKWIELELHPDKIDDSALDARLAPFRPLRMGTKEIVENLPPDQLIKQIADGKASLPQDPTKRAIYEAQLQRYEDKQERKDKDKSKPPESPAATGEARNTCRDGACPGSADSAPLADPEQTRRREDRRRANLRAQELLDLPPDERMKEILKMSPEDRRTIATTTKGASADALRDGMSPQQKETMQALNNPQQVVVNELTQAKLLRAIYSERQLDEVMTDFWFNHFNVFINKDADRYLLTSYERDAIRPHVLGKFEDLLVATAKSPAMLFYLDNWLSVGPNSMRALGIPDHPVHPYGSYGRPHRFPPPNAKAKRKANNGLNENYGRELLELHTLSVNGGYSQRDVTEVAKVFTGWTIEKPNEGGGFKYDPRMHQPGPKFVLGHHIKPKGNGEDEGREVLHLLATRPQTAHFISLKLAQRFVSDDPPPALVDRMAKTFEKKKGDIREVLSTLFHSPEFWADGAYRAKVKTPLEFVASAVRATGADVDDAMPLARQVANMGMPLYGAQPPTGYSMKADTWVSSSALLNRMNFALALTGGKVRGVKIDAVQLAGGPPAPADATMALSAMEAKLLGAA